jgi:hypothetical protein
VRGLGQFVDFLRAEIDRYGDFAVDLKVGGRRLPRPAEPLRRVLPVTAVDCCHDRQEIRLVALQAEDGLTLGDLLRAMSTAMAQGPEYSLAVSAGLLEADPDTPAFPVAGLRLRPSPRKRRLRFDVTVDAAGR